MFLDMWHSHNGHHHLWFASCHDCQANNTTNSTNIRFVEHCLALLHIFTHSSDIIASILCSASLSFGNIFIQPRPSIAVRTSTNLPSVLSLHDFHSSRSHTSHPDLQDVVIEATLRCPTWSRPSIHSFPSRHRQHHIVCRLYS